MEVWIRLGRQPRMTDLTSHTSQISADTYKRRFAGWRSALEAFVRWVNDGGNSAADRFATEVVPRSPQRGPREPSLRLRFLVMQRDKFKCQCCGLSPSTDSSVKLHVDHRMAWSRGGETVFENLQTLCEQCNLGKGDAVLSE